MSDFGWNKAIQKMTDQSKETELKPEKCRSLTCAHCGKETVALIGVLESETAYELGLSEQHTAQLLKDKEELVDCLKKATRTGYSYNSWHLDEARALLDRLSPSEQKDQDNG